METDRTAKPQPQKIKKSSLPKPAAAAVAGKGAAKALRHQGAKKTKASGVATAGSSPGM